eukprot:7056623-Pyramimonas_sp.AAC.1
MSFTSPSVSCPPACNTRSPAPPTPARGQFRVAWSGFRAAGGGYRAAWGGFRAAWGGLRAAWGGFKPF